MGTDTKLRKKLFEDDMEIYSSFMRENMDWILQKIKYAFEKDEIIQLLDLVQRVEKVIVKNNQEK